MSKKLNYVLSNETVNLFSEYNKAYFALTDLNNAHKDIIKALNDELKGIKENRTNDLKAGLPLDEVIRKWSTVDVETRIEVENSAYETKAKPYKDTQKDFEKTMPELSEVVANFNNNCGKITNDDRLKMRTYLETIGAVGVESQAALDKAIRGIFPKIGGMRIDRKNKGHLKENSKSQIKAKLAHALIMFFIEKGILLENKEDGTLTLNLGK